MSADIEFLQKISAAIDACHKAFGAPGDYGYGTPKGDALFALYRVRVDVGAAKEVAPAAALSMTLRDWLASQALAGLASRADRDPTLDLILIRDGAYALADAMLAARKAPGDAA